MKCNWHVQDSCLRNKSVSPSSLTAMLFVADSPELWLDPNEGHSWMLTNVQPLGR